MSNEAFFNDISKIKNSNDDYEQPIKIFHNLMPYKVREILLVSSLYDAFIVEEEGLISEMVIWEYRHLLLSSPPRVTHVTSGEEALALAQKNKYDLVITMSKNIGMDPYEFGKKIKKSHPALPVILLATDNADLHFCQKNINKMGIDNAFFWYGDTSLFLVIIKSIEDKINAKYDTVNGNVQVIIVIEDSIRDYSNLLPIIYSAIVQQTQRSISDDLNETQRLLRRKARPKILLTNNYEEAVELYNKYKNNVLGIISDVTFPKKGNLDHQAGHDFISYVKKDNPFIPMMLQSTDINNKKRAEALKVYFIHKNSSSILDDYNHFLVSHLGFGDFVFLLPIKFHERKESNLDSHDGTKEITSASNLVEFEKALQQVPLESIRFHSNRNDFSNWLMARGEFKLANKLRPQRVQDFETLNELKKYLVNIFNESRRERQLGVMADFSQQKFEFDSSYTKIGGDSLGGKGRGIAFIRSLLARQNFEKKYDNIKITVPSTVAIGTDEFDKFIKDNDLTYLFQKYNNLKDKEIAEIFLKSKLSAELINKLSTVLKHFKKPIAIRSSSLLEDSQNHPFAGMYSTYMLPNNNKDELIRLEQLCKAIKLVYASVFFKDATAYIEKTSAKIEEEKMAVIIQELIGSEYEGFYYPTISGVGQSYNFYPVSRQERNDGIVSLAVGLGYSVVGGEKVLRFSPKHPKLIPDFSTPESIINNTQTELYVLNMDDAILELSEKEEANLDKISISEIAKDGTLEYLSSTYDIEDGMIRDNFNPNGPHLITFAGILKYNIFPLASILKELLEEGEKSLGSPVEIEFAVNVDPKGVDLPVFAVIQIRPFIVSKERIHVSWELDDINIDDVIMHSNKSLGNGIIDNVYDIVFIPPETFDSTKTVQIAEEIGNINKDLADSQYILIGPGRWGSQDRFLGIPVLWSEISNAKVIVETALEDFNIKPSQGTHFFQNIISQAIGYINITLNKEESMIDWNWLNSMEMEKEFKFVKHIRLSYPLDIKLDGRTGRAIITKHTKDAIS